MIRDNTIKYSSDKKKKRLKEEKTLEEDIKRFENELYENGININNQTVANLVQKQNQLINVRNEKIEGVMLRSKCRYMDLGEEPTNYFFNLENRNYTSKVINKLIYNDIEYTKTNEVLNCQKQFYEKLYDNVNEIDEYTPIENIIGENGTQLSEAEAQKTEGEMTYIELTKALKNMKNEKSPGLDGFTVEFFKFFWIDIGVFVLRSINYGYRTGSLSVTQKQGIITYLPKPNKCRYNLKNWRPISLLNVVYKMASAVIANRPKSTLDELIHENQKGVISGRSIGENKRLIYDVLFETKNRNLQGLILSIDFEKALDTVSWKFIEKTLRYYNFGDSIIKWISIFQKGVESCIIQNGFISEFFYLKRGCRQGDPISPYIFILCAEILGKMIRNNNDIRGIIIDNKEYKISQYADDTQLFLNGSENSLREALDVLQKIYEMSGLKINVEKTKAIWIGSLSNSPTRLCHNYTLDWTQGPFKILGVTFSTEIYNIWGYNQKSWRCLQAMVKKKINSHRQNNNHKVTSTCKVHSSVSGTTKTPDDFLKTIERIFYKFLWNGGPDRIKRIVIVKNLKAGGLRMVNLSEFINALKISWPRRAIQSSENVECYSLSKVDFHKLLSCVQDTL